MFLFIKMLEFIWKEEINVLSTKDARRGPEDATRGNLRNAAKISTELGETPGGTKKGIF